MMWSQTLISNWMAKNWGRCARDTVRSGLAYPGQPPAEAAEATRNQGGWYNSMMWSCDSVFDPEGGSCRLRINELACYGVSYDNCVAKLRAEPAWELTSQVLDPLFT